jgi:tetratricopeptide (TPR) repeat protein
MSPEPPKTSHANGGRETGSSLEQAEHVLERDIPFSQSIIWRMQRDFYARQGLKAWTQDLVPSYITSNPLIAEIYAAIVAGFLSDCLAQSQVSGALPLSPESPLRIVELGAGTGKFACLFLRKLTALLGERGIAQRLVRYVMTDCAEEVIDAWRRNRYLREFAEQGILDFRLLPAGEERLMDLGAEKNQTGPLVVVANYVFDSLPQDAFAISNGEIAEMLVTTSGSSETISARALLFNNVPLRQRRYADPSWNQILEHYRKNVPEATILFPCVALKTLEQLGRLSDGRMLVLAADKGFVYEDELTYSRGAPSLEFHSGNCFSQQVNFDAIGKYFVAKGGQALLPDKHFSSLSICGFLLDGSHAFAATSAAYRSAQAQVGPDDVFTLLGWLNAHMEEMNVAQILAMLRLSRWDPVALTRIFPVLVRQLGAAGAERNDLREAVMRVWANRFPVTAADNVLAFDSGVILLELRFYADALMMFQASELMLGRSAATSYNLGLCAAGLGRNADARKYMEQALQQDPSFASAGAALQKLEAEGTSQ